MDCVGVAYHHLGRHTNAVAAYQQALALFRDNGEGLEAVGSGFVADDRGGCWAASTRIPRQRCWAISTAVDHANTIGIRAVRHPKLRTNEE